VAVISASLTVGPAWQATGTKAQVSQPFVMETYLTVNGHLYDLWCWAAATASIRDFYRRSSPAHATKPPLTQCEVVSTQRNDPSCCGPQPYCNKPGYLDLALNAASHLQSTVGAISWSAIVTQLTAATPPIVQVRWTGSRAVDHVIGVSEAGQDGNGDDYIKVGDPNAARNPSYVILTRLSMYAGGCTWQHTCLTT
jgi:hypothetical protein